MSELEVCPHCEEPFAEQPEESKGGSWIMWCENCEDYIEIEVWK